MLVGAPNTCIVWTWQALTHRLKGAFPNALGAWSKMISLTIEYQDLRGTIPDTVGHMTALHRLFSDDLPLRGTIPDAIGSMTALQEFDLSSGGGPHGHLRGPIPEVVGYMIALVDFDVAYNRLSGAIPHAFGSLERIKVVDNNLRGAIPDAIFGSMQGEQSFAADVNSLRGPIPHAVGSLRGAADCSMSYNSLRGSIPQAVGFMSLSETFFVSFNSLHGPISQAAGSMQRMQIFGVSSSSLSGTLPAVMTWNAVFFGFDSSDNQLSGSIPSGFFMHSGADTPFVAFMHRNQLTGTLPTLKNVEMLTASGYLLEGGLSNTFGSELRVLDLYGVPGRSRGLIGPLPPALRQASMLKILAITNQQMHGGIPSFTSTLSILALHNNHLKVLPAVHFEENFSKTTILLFNNVLSCSLPMCGNIRAKTSLVAIGNRLNYPKGDFPAWVFKYERDPLLWVAGTDGMSLLVKISGASGLFMFVVVLKLGNAKLLRAMIGWQIGPATHLWVVKKGIITSSCRHVDGFFIGSGLHHAPFVLGLYVCPQTLALMSTCSRSSALIRTLVLMCWCKLSCYSQAVEHLTMKGENQNINNQKTWTARTSRERLLWLVWCVLIVVLSTLAILYQVVKSIPAFLQMGKIYSLGLRAGIGAIQGLVGKFVMPHLASKLTRQKYVFTAVSSLAVSCLFPAVLIIYLDAGCLSRWVTLWKPCRSSRHLFQRRFVCIALDNEQDCIGDEHEGNFDNMILHSSDVCDPHFSWSSTSVSGCIHITLLRFKRSGWQSLSRRGWRCQAWPSWGANFPRNLELSWAVSGSACLMH